MATPRQIIATALANELVGQSLARQDLEAHLRTIQQTGPWSVARIVACFRFVAAERELQACVNNAARLVRTWNLLPTLGPSADEEISRIPRPAQVQQSRRSLPTN